MRGAGVLLPVFSLHSEYGIGSFSHEAGKFIDRISAGGQSYWQILPVTPSGKGNSPYTPLSCFAGDPIYIDPATLYEHGMITFQELSELVSGPGRIDYVKVRCSREKILPRAFERFCEVAGNDTTIAADFDKFCADNAYWLDNYSLFMALRTHFSGTCWTEWPEQYKFRNAEVLSDAILEHSHYVMMHKWMQYEFNREWQIIRKYANENGIRIIGDIPIYASLDSSDCWANPEMFKLDDDMHPIAVSGCPPDFFSPEGQVWENPLYDWDAIARDGYGWWLARLKRCGDLYDIVRLDHARGFASYYSIPSDTMQAADGYWIEGPGMGFFDAMRDASGIPDLILEDLGMITEDVRSMMQETCLPTMDVIQMAFDSDEKNPYLPENVRKHSIMYTGTHDTDTLAGWYQNCSEHISGRAEKYVIDWCHKNAGRSDIASRSIANINDGRIRTEDIVSCLIEIASDTIADICIVPIQDYLHSGSEARINVPGVADGNWEWRLDEDIPGDDVIEYMRKLAIRTRRIN